MIRETLVKNSQLCTKLKASSIPSIDNILRAASVSPSFDTEEKLKDFIIDYALFSLRLSDDIHILVTVISFVEDFSAVSLLYSKFS
jgi:hypothetical protein